MPAKKNTGKEVVDFNAKLAEMAAKSSTLTNSTGGGKFFSTSAGVLKFDDSPLPGNQMAVIVIGHCLENVYYEGDYDPQAISPPTCFAFCKDPDLINEFGPPDDMDEAFEAQNDTCKGCWANEFGSAAKGKGKACSNRRRLALLPAGTYDKNGELELFDELEHYTECEEAYLKLPVMSGKGFDNYLKQVANQVGKPLFAVFTRIYLEPDPKSQFRVNFELIEDIDDEEWLQALFARYETIMEGIDFPYAPPSEEEEQPKAKAAASKKLTKRGGAAARGRK